MSWLLEEEEEEEEEIEEKFVLLCVNSSHFRFFRIFILLFCNYKTLNIQINNNDIKESFH